MVTKVSRTLGDIDCLACGEKIPVKENEAGTLNLSCPWCGLSAYAKAGTEAHGIANGWVRKPDKPDKTAGAGAATVVPSREDTTAAAPAPAASVASIAATARKAFSLGDL